MRNGEQAAYEYVDKHFDEWLKKTIDYLKIPSISLIDKDDEEGRVQMLKAANFVLKVFDEVGAEGTEIVETTGWPVVYGKLMSKNPKAKTLLIYGMYDVMPVTGEKWTFPPFEAKIVDAEKLNLPPQIGKVICARGTMNQKVPHMGTLLGLKALKAATGDVPVNVLLFCEGEEELGSPSMHEFIEAKRHELQKAEGELVPGRTQGHDGTAGIHLGQKGCIMVELHVKGGDWGGPAEHPVFASEAAWIDSPIWRLVWSLNTIKDSTDRVLIDGFYDDVKPPTPEQRTMIRGLEKAWDETDGGAWPRDGKQTLGVKKFLRGLPGRELIKDYIMKPMINIDGISGGYTGPKVYTHFPRSAFVKMDIRIVPEQRPEDIVWKLRRHLNTHGFPEVEVRVLGTNPWSRIDPECDIVKAAKKTYEKMGFKYVLNPIYAGSGPHEGHIRKPLGFSGRGLEFGLGIGSNPHSPDEYENVEGLRGAAKSYITFLYEYADL